MNENVKELLDIINSQMKLYKDLLDLSRNKTGIIIEGKVKDLDSITKLEQGMIVEVGRLENKRVEVSSKIFEQLGLPSNSTMSDISDHLQEDIKNNFINTREEMAKILDDLATANQHNGRLIMQSLEYIEFNINMVSGASTNETYDSSVTSKSNNQAKKLFDVKI